MKNVIASKVLMIEPVRFGFNQQTAATNAFQNKEISLAFSPQQIQDLAAVEFHNLVGELRDFGVEVMVVKDTNDPFTPDSIFPNNWFNTDANGVLLTYPMASENRRKERREDVLDELGKMYALNRTLEKREKEGLYLEGTGSLIIDQVNKTAFAALSPRTNENVLEEYTILSGNKVVTFTALGPAGEKIYHTNVMLCLTDSLAIVGANTIVEEDRKRVLSELSLLKKEMLYLTNEQVYHHFVGNMLQLQNMKGERCLVMSSNARSSLTAAQIKLIEDHGNQIIDVPLAIVEQIGGGSARCMLAELF